LNPRQQMLPLSLLNLAAILRIKIRNTLPLTSQAKLAVKASPCVPDSQFSRKIVLTVNSIVHLSFSAPSQNIKEHLAQLFRRPL
jgi:hypothetical protein